MFVSTMQLTQGALTLIATVSFALTFVVGVWLGARTGNRSLIPALLTIVVMGFVRAGAPALGFYAIASVSVIHLATGVITALILRRTKTFRSSDRNDPNTR